MAVPTHSLQGRSLDVYPPGVQGSSTIRRAQRSPSSCMVVTVNCKLGVSPGGRSSASLWSPGQCSRDTDESCFCRHSEAAQVQTLLEWENSAPQGLWLHPHIPTGSIPVLASAAWSLPGQGSLQGDAGIAQQHGLHYKPHSNYISQEQH